MKIPAPISRRAVMRRSALAGAFSAAAASGLARAAGAVVEVEALRRAGASDAAVIRLGLAELARRGGGVLTLAGGRTYDLGRVQSPGFVFHLRGMREARIEGNGATLVCETIGSGKTQMFLVQNCHGITFSNLVARDRGADIRRDWKGMDFVHLEGGGGPSSRIALENVSVEDAVSVLSSSGTGNGRISGITLTNVVAMRCYYGLNFQENGDDVRGALTARNCRRAYFPYGVTGHNLQFDIHHDGAGPAADACILIARKERDTSNITVRARFSGVLPWTNLVHLVQQPPVLARGLIRDIAIDLFVDPSARDPNNAARMGVSGYIGKVALPTTNDRWENVSLTGCFGRMRGDPVVFYSHAPAANIRVARSC